MATPRPICPVCAHPILFGTSTIRTHGAMAHLTCQEFAPAENRWPDGIRRLVCLKCGRAFESDSKAQRLCRACRAGDR